MKITIENIQWEYTELVKKESRDFKTEYFFAGAKFDWLMDALQFVGQAGWELVGQIDGKLILKRVISDE